MYNIQSKNRTYLLERLENYGNQERFEIEGNQDFSIEHILPQTPSKEWKEELADQFDEMKKFTNTVANLTLSVFNKELSNYSFAKKRDMPEKGYKASKLGMNRQLSKFDSWNIETLNSRYEWIKIRFADIWKYPNIVIDDDTVVNDEIDILDIIPTDVTNRSMEYFKFFSEIHKTPSWRHLLKIVSVVMFEREPHMFIATDLSYTLKLTQDKNTLIDPLKISQTYYIESRLSAQAIVNKVQKILDKCETDDELLIKFNNNENANPYNGENSNLVFFN